MTLNVPDLQIDKKVLIKLLNIKLNNPSDEQFDNLDRPFITIRRIGINTVGDRLGGNYDIRGPISNPQNLVSPWLQSSYGPDTIRRPLL